MKYAVVIILAILALIINFTPKLILKKVFKKDEKKVSNNAVLGIKFFAAALAVFVFILTLAWL